MTAYEFGIAEKIHAKRYPFFSLIMAAMMHGGYGDGYILKDHWPHIYSELHARLNDYSPFLVMDKAQTTFSGEKWEDI